MDSPPFIVGYIVFVVLCLVVGLRSGRGPRTRGRPRGGLPRGPHRSSGSDGGTYVPSDRWSGHMSDGGGGHGHGHDGDSGGGHGGGDSGGGDGGGGGGGD
ncbi:hypothetical protein ACMA46_04020 [Clavibacter sp. Sh2141]|uniref:hypothetical protein n=1 Tax=unclassified Clavibacter TaxID=2626594 RepID=UPI0039BD6B2D